MSQFRVQEKQERKPRMNIEQQLHNLQVSFSRDLWSKLTDGILAAIILFLLWLLVILAVRPIELRMGQPGLMIYSFGLMAVSMYSLQHSVFHHHAETTRAWYGIVSGSLAWSVIEISTYLGAPMQATTGDVVLVIMVSLIFMLLWRSSLPVGMRFFGMTVLFNWAELILMHAQASLTGLSPIFELTFRLTGYTAIFLILLAVGYILSYSRRRIQRISAALVIWFLVSVAVYVFWGPFF